MPTTVISGNARIHDNPSKRTLHALIFSCPSLVKYFHNMRAGCRGAPTSGSGSLIAVESCRRQALRECQPTPHDKGNASALTSYFFFGGRHNRTCHCAQACQSHTSAHDTSAGAKTHKNHLQEFYRTICEGNASTAADTALSTRLSVEDVRRYFRRRFQHLSSSHLPRLAVARQGTATLGCSPVDNHVLPQLIPPGKLVEVHRFPLSGSATEAISFWSASLSKRHMATSAGARYFPARAVVTIAGASRGQGASKSDSCEYACNE